MSALAIYLRVLPRAHKLSQCAPTRSFHSPFVVLNASKFTAAPSSFTAAPIYEKQDDGSPEPHLSSSGTRTYVVSEPDPSNAPYEVPAGAYPTSASYASRSPTDAANPESLCTSTSPGGVRQ